LDLEREGGKEESGKEERRNGAREERGKEGTTDQRITTDHNRPQQTLVVIDHQPVL
jgi:hypothetical protein